MRIAFDIHGVIDTVDLSVVARKLYENDHIVFILTGMHWSDDAKDYLKRYGFEKDFNYTKFLSISDYHKEIGTEIHYDEQGNPWLDDRTWNSTKAQICFDYSIDVLIDDSEIYLKYFDETHDTEYILFNKNTVISDIDRFVNLYNTHDPYVVIERVIRKFKWNPKYNQDALCECGHSYSRHFDPYERMEAVGCKYCSCCEFKPRSENG